MATYTNSTVGWGFRYDIDLSDNYYTDWKYGWSWQGDFYVGGYTLYIERNDKVNGLFIDYDWENLVDGDYYVPFEDSDGDICARGSVVYAKDGAVLNNVTLERGVFFVNPDGDDNNPHDNRWSTTVNGLDIYGEYAICYAYQDSVLNNVTVSNGALYSYSTGMNDLTVSKQGKVNLRDGSGTTELTVVGGFVQASNGSYIQSATVSGGEFFIHAQANVDDVYVFNKGIMITEGNVVFRDAVIGNGGTLVVSTANNNIADYTFESGSRISIGTGIYKDTASRGLDFAAGVTVGYGFNNGRFSYQVGGIYYSASNNISRNYVVADELVKMTDGQQAYDMIVEDGGAFMADGGVISGLTVNMNFAVFQDDAEGRNLVLNSPELIESEVVCQVGDTAQVDGVKVNDKAKLQLFDQAQVANIILNDQSECAVSSDSTAVTIDTITVNDSSLLKIRGATSVEHLTVNSGVVELFDTSAITDVLMNGGAIHSWDGDHIIRDIQQYGGIIAVQGKIDGIMVYDGGRLAQVGDSTTSGEISNMTLQSGAWLSINNISTINGGFDPSDITVGYNFNSGYQRNGNESYKYIVTFYNVYSVGNGKTARDMCVSVGNTNVFLRTGGTMIGGDIENGCLTVEGGSVMSGSINLYGETYYQEDNYGYHDAAGIHFLTDDTTLGNATFNFVLGQNKQLDNYVADPLVKPDIGLVFDENFGDDEIDKFNLSLTLNETLKSGEEYSMFLGTGFKFETIDVYGKNGNFLGTASFGRDLNVDNKTISVVEVLSTGKLYTTQWGVKVVSHDRNDVGSDIDGNGIADVLLTISRRSHAAFGSTGAWLIQDNDTAQWSDLSTMGANNRLFGIGRTDASKNAKDIYVENTSTHTIGAWVTDESGKVAGWQTIGQFDAATQIMGLGDFNGDGQSDLLLRNSNGAVGCYFTSGSKIGWNYFQSLGDEWQISAIGDFNSDGRDDIVLKHDAGFAGCWLTNTNGTVSWSDLSTVGAGFDIVGSGDFNGDGTADVLLEKDGYFGAWLVKNGSASGWMGLGQTAGTVEQIGDFNGDGIDDLRIRTAAGDIGALLVCGEDSLDWKYYGSVGSEWSTSLAAL